MYSEPLIKTETMPDAEIRLFYLLYNKGRWWSSKNC